MNKLYTFFLLLLLPFGFKSFGQTLPVGLLDNFEDNLRRQQLLGNDTSHSSFMVRPLNISNRNNWLLDEGSDLSLSDFKKEIFSAVNGRYSVSLLPVTWQQQFNGHSPYGMNDGSMIPSRGYQTQLAAGVYAKIGPLSIQLRPEYVYAENKDFRELYEAPIGTNVTDRYVSKFVNGGDAPERFGNKTYSRASWGQSSIRLTFDPVSVGLSNENLWWGPGMRSSLLMSNNASGFKHITLNTSRPVNTPIGSFETQIVAGRLELSRVPTIDYAGARDQPDDWRYLSGIVFSYQPKWVPGLFLGFDRAFVVNKKNLGNSFGDYFPLFAPIEKVNTSAATDPAAEDKRMRDQYFAFFGRWVMPESHAEVYIEYGRNDHPYDARDGFLTPEHSRAYIAGFRKLVPLRASDEFIQVGVEFTQMEGSRTGANRAQPSWYVHSQVPGGYTNKGQILGAGIGSGSDLQSLDVSWVKGLKRIGVQVERYVHNNDLFYAVVVDGRRNWVDLTFGSKFDWTYKNFVVNSQLTYIHSLNYQYEIQANDKTASTFWDTDRQDADNLHLKVGLMYRW